MTKKKETCPEAIAEAPQQPGQPDPLWPLADSETSLHLPAPQQTLALQKPSSLQHPELAIAGQADELKALAAEIARRKIEALRLYEPLPCWQKFHESGTRVRLLIDHNRSGKTLAGCVEIARAVTAQDPFGKYPKKNGRCYVIVKTLDHVGQILWPKLGRAMAFKMIRDLQTKEWRAFRPWEPADKAREHQAKYAPPLIPQRFIAGRIAWENKAKMIPKQVRLVTGWEITFYSAESEPQCGADVDLVLFDEEIPNEAWYTEMRWRILDRKGKIIWPATPQEGTQQLYGLYERAEQEEADPPESRTVERFSSQGVLNPHIDAQEFKDAANDPSMSDEQYKVRVLGHFAFIGYRVYPEYAPSIHGIDLETIPAHWTRYVVTDPGHQVCAVLFAAVTPPEEGDWVVLYDELYLKECTAARYAEALKVKSTGQTFQEFLIDYHGSIRSDTGIGKSILEQYVQALTERGIRSVSTGNGFAFGSSDVAAGILKVHEYLAVRDGGTPRLRIARGRLPNFEREIKYYHKRRVAGQIVDQPDQRKNNHLMDCTRYLCMREPRWVKPEPVPAATAAGGYQRVAKMFSKGREQPTGVRLGPCGKA